MKNLLYTLCLVSLFLYLHPAIAQEAQIAIGTNDGNVHEIENVTRNFYAAMQEVMSNHDGKTMAIEKMLANDFTSVRYMLDANGQQSRSVLNTTAFNRELAQLSKTTGFSAHYEIEKVNYLQSSESFAIINFTLMVNGSLKEEEVFRYKTTVTHYLMRGSDGQWLVFESNSVSVRNDLEVATCPVGFSKKLKDESSYSVTVISPEGCNFKIEELDFIFKGDQTKTTITCNQNTYTLENLRATCIKDNGKAANIELGRATGRMEAINLILAQHLYLHKCVGFKSITD
jgi:hypothetical protein